MNKFVLILILFLGGISHSFSQVSEKIFYDGYAEANNELNKVIQYNDYIILGGKGFETNESVPYLKAVDQNGNLIWSTVADDLVEGTVRDFFLGEDDYIYVFCDQAGVAFDSDKELWKVDPQNGEILWKQLITFDFGSSTWIEARFFDLGTDNIGLLAFNQWSDNDSLLITSKANGTVVESYHLGFDGDYDVNVIVDDQLNLYCTRQDSIMKFAATDYSQRDWSVELDEFQNFMGIEYDLVNDQVILFGELNSNIERAAMAAINPDTGAQNWYLLPDENMDSKYSSSVLTNEFLYVNWRHATTGGGTYRLLTYKIDLLSGALIWDSKIYAIGNQEQASLDFLLDDSEDLIMTGYFEADNFGPGKWLLVKLDGENGEIIYTNHFTLLGTQSADESRSTGRKVIRIDDKFFVVGTMEDSVSDFQYHPTVIHFNPDTGEEIQKWFFDGSAQLFTKIIDAIPIDGSDVICLVQEGTHGKLVRLDANGVVLWEERIFSFQNFVADKIGVSPNNEIVVYGTKNIFDFDPGYPYFNGQVDLMYILRFDIDGNLINREERSLNNVAGFSVDYFYSTGMLLSEDRSLIFGRTESQSSNDNLFVLQVEDNAFSSYDINSFITSNHRPHNNVISIDENSALVYTGESANRIIHLDLNSGMEINTYALGAVPTLDVKMTDQNRAVSVGNFSSNPHVFCLSTSTFDELWSYSNTNVSGIFEKVEVANGLVFALGVNQNTDEYFVTCLNENTGEEIWTINLGDGFPNCKGQHLAFNHFTNELAVGSLFNSNPANPIYKDVLVEFYDIDGNRSSYFERTGITPHEEVEITSLKVSPTGRTLVCANIMVGIGNDNNAPNGVLLSFGSDIESYYYKGKIFYDANQNGTQQADEPFLAVGNIWIDSLDFGYIPNNNNQFGFYSNPGLHSYTYLPEEDWLVTTDSTVFHFIAGQTPTSEEFCIGIFPDTIYSELDIVMNGHALRCFEPSIMYIDIFEVGTSFGTGMVTVEVPDDIAGVQFQGLQPDTIIGIQYTFTVDLKPSCSEPIIFSFVVPGVAAIGETLTFTTTANAFDSNGQLMTTASNSYADVVVCSYDPNDKLANPPGVGTENYTLFETELDYTIRFQNTGNGNANRVRLVDTLDSNLNWSSLRVNTASHPLAEVRRVDNVVEFIFDPISLPYEAIDTLGSQGFVSFSIEPNGDLPENTIIENSAAIYFDFNPPIITNTTVNTFVSEYPVSIQNISVLGAQLIPNPFQSSTFVEIQNRNNLIPMRAYIYDIYGKQIGFQEISSEFTELNFEHLPAAIYFIKISTTDGKVIETLKALKL